MSRNLHPTASSSSPSSHTILKPFAQHCLATFIYPKPKPSSPSSPAIPKPFTQRRQSMLINPETYHHSLLTQYNKLKPFTQRPLARFHPKRSDHRTASSHKLCLSFEKMTRDPSFLPMSSALRVSLAYIAYIAHMRISIEYNCKCSVRP